jgi:tripartite-type tricarboxylate transporter receptor subunit TctC
MKSAPHPRNILAALLFALAVSPASAQPAKNVRFLVGAPAGGSNDIFARAIGQRLSESIGQPVVVDNRPGASQMIAADLTAKAPPDGNTLYMTSTTYTTGAALMAKLPFDPVNDLTGVTMVARGPMVLVVHPSVPAKSVKELIALARARPGQLQGGTSGAGSPSGLSLQRLKSLSGVSITDIPFKTIAQAFTDTAAGQIHFTFTVVPAVLPSVRAGRLRGLAVTSLKRTPLAPELPTIAETIPGYEVIGWYGLVAPARTPPEIITKLNTEIGLAMRTPEVLERLETLGAELSPPANAQAFGAYLAAQIEQSRQLIKESGAVPD